VQASVVGFRIPMGDLLGRVCHSAFISSQRIARESDPFIPFRPFLCAALWS
jgi:hypothetical protein